MSFCLNCGKRNCLRTSRFLITVVVIFLSAIVCVIPTVSAQSVEVSLAQNPPTRVLVGRDLTVTVSATYDLGYNGKYLTLLVWNLGTTAYATGTSSSDVCMSNAGTEYSDSAACTFIPTSSTGSVTIAFNLQFNTAQTYQLEGAAGITDSSGNVIALTATPASGICQYQFCGAPAPFDITATDQLEFTVEANTPSPLSVLVDGVSTYAGSTNDLYPGIHSVSVPSVIQIGSSERAVFMHWSDGSTDVNRSMNLQDDTTLTADYVTQYRLILITSPVNVTGAGWYNSGSTATLSIPSSYFFLWTFQGWYENGKLITSSDNSSIVMNAPHSITARWGLDYILLSELLAAIAVVVFGVAYSRKKRMPTTKTIMPESKPMTVAEEAATITQPSSPVTRSKGKNEMFCKHCGNVIPRDSKFCKECGEVV